MMSFKRGEDPHSAIGVGQMETSRYWIENILKLYATTYTTYEQISDNRYCIIGGIVTIPEDITYIPENIDFRICIVRIYHPNVKIHNKTKFHHLDLKHAGNIKLPDELVINGYCDCAHNKDLQVLPESMHIKQELILLSSGIQELPFNLYANEIYLYNTRLAGMKLQRIKRGKNIRAKKIVR